MPPPRCPSAPHVDGLVERIRAEIGAPCRILPTGGFASLIAPEACASCTSATTTPADRLAPEEPTITKPNRNDPCHCGSGKKYKKCHLAADEAAFSKELAAKNAAAAEAAREAAEKDPEAAAAAQAALDDAQTAKAAARAAKPAINEPTGRKQRRRGVA